jgi:hypothetical protein
MTWRFDEKSGLENEGKCHRTPAGLVRLVKNII